MSCLTHRADPLFARLNGWRRLGVVFVCAWLVVGGMILWQASAEVASKFPNLAEPVVGVRFVPAPELREQLEAAKVKQLGRALKPWEMEWNPVREVPVQLALEMPPISRWFLLFAVPVLGWCLVELLVRVGLWVRAGFATR